VPIYAERGILREVDGMAAIDEVSAGIDAALKEAV
jgi:adenylate kinase